MNDSSGNSYYNNDYVFDIKKFNKDFESYLSGQKAKRLEREKKFLESKEILTREKLLHELTILEIIVNVKLTFFSMMDDLLNGNIGSDFLTKENRLFYVGISILAFCFTLIALNKLLSNPKNKKINDDTNINLNVKLNNITAEQKNN